jgi:hypothetical protein
MSTTQYESIFARQEQAVVYFFSRYWHQIESFRDKRLVDIQAHFPDASMEDTKTGNREAIEFEYALSGFYGHLRPSKWAVATRRTLKRKDYKSLCIVYWEQDTDKGELRDEIKKKCPDLKKVDFVDLSKCFSPCVEPELDRLRASWEFRQEKCVDEVYSNRDIEAETRALAKEGVIRLLKVKNGQRGRDLMYRVAGFNTRNSDFIECGHWKRIHFYTTSYFHDESIPARLFLKPTGSGRYLGCFEVRLAFRILRPESKRLADYYRRFYFYPYRSYDPEDLLRHTNLVYSSFTDLDVEQGVKIYDYLRDEGYIQQMTSEKVEDRTDLNKIKKIVG